MLGPSQAKRTHHPDHNVTASPSKLSSVRPKNGSTEGADYGSPGLPIEGDEDESSGGFHVRDAGPPAAPRADPSRWLAALHLPLLIHKKAEEHHLYHLSNFSSPQGSLFVFWG